MRKATQSSHVSAMGHTWAMTSHVHRTYSPLPHHIGTRSIALQSLLGYLFVPSDAKASRPHVWRFSPLLKENKFLQKCGVSSLILVDFINFQFFSPSFVITVNFPSEVSGNFEQQHIESSVESTAIFNFFIIRPIRHHSTLDRHFYPSFKTIFF